MLEPWRRTALPAAALALLFVSLPMLADEDEMRGTADEVDRVLDAFEEEPFEVPEDESETFDQPSFWELSGAVTLRASYAFDGPDPEGGPDYRGLVRLPVEIDLQLDLSLPRDWRARVAGRAFYDFAYLIEGRDEFPSEVRSAYERDYDFTEVYVQGSLSRNLDLKIGRQVVNWGRSLNLRVLDVLNPLDLREPGLTDLEDLRLPVTMSRLDYYAGRWQLTGIAIHEIRFNEGLVRGSDWIPLSVPDLPRNEPRTNLSNTEFAVALSGFYPHGDISFHAARIFDDFPHVEATQTGAVLKHSRLTLLGTGFSVPSGNWLLFSELAAVQGLEFFATNDEKWRFDGLIGLEYSGWNETTLTVEVAYRHLRDFDPDLRDFPDEAQRGAPVMGLRYSRDFWNDRLHATVLAQVFGWRAEDGSFVRCELDYDVMDGLNAAGGVALYQDGDLPFFRYSHRNDRLYLKIRHSF